ncbi:MAG TPA: transcription-repair coupling factor [Candidatus Angelobacter sp.]|nr:transcription-repair coupling factor [Candidatus Angelobacter sp.]
MQTPAAQSLLRRVEEGGALSCTGVSRSAQPFLAALLRHVFPKRPIAVVTPELKSQESFQQDITTWLRAGESGVVQDSQSLVGTAFFFPAWEILAHDAKLPHVDVVSERLETLVALTRNQTPGGKQAPLVVASVTAVLQRTFPVNELKNRTKILTHGDRFDPTGLIKWLEMQGYETEAQVTQKGETALRGGILDVWSPASPWPVRLEFFGDEVESLRFFDPFTQISRENTNIVTLPPAGELGLLKRRVQKSEAPGRNSETHSPTASPELSTLLDYLPQETIVLLCEPEDLDQHAGQSAQQMTGNDPFFIQWKDFQGELAARGMTVLETSESDTAKPRPLSSAGLQTMPLPLSSLDAFRPLGAHLPEPQIAEAQRLGFLTQLHRWLRQGYVVHVFCNNEGERERFREIWAESGFGNLVGTSSPSIAEAHADVPETAPILSIGALCRGFLFDEGKLVVVTDAEIFGRYKVQRPRRLKSPHAAAMRSALDIDFTELEEGDYVVHVQHGIGRYLGLKALPPGAGRKGTWNQKENSHSASDADQECLVIEYASSEPNQPPPRLYVPVTESHLISKYVGAGKARPPLNLLGGTRWARTKEQAEKAVRDLAGELLAIQAARESQAGHAFKPDAPWQREFEGAFIFEETPDQMRAISETKADMEKPKPMDRLICGDVGFGKTEVAIRAAFKAVMDGRQVAVLVPTTVLAQQHFNTFRDRMADYPVRIELLSRFRKPRQQQSVIKDLVAGAVDIIIGTHRLVQEDVHFKELGLVVIDEEQRFGVMQKEKFKLLRKLVDVLTLSATPIPRTLYLALTGARDMSTIETPPQDRLPVETLVIQYDERVIRDAIQRELNRGGQVFFLHNRVMTIDATARKLRALVPRARVVVGHGQMQSEDLEEVMTRFVNGEADVLLSTTIIESGLDIPNANTIIIDRADRFGLSDLYQLRGRVGRYKNQAYAYLLLPRHAGLLADARKRISAIKQYSTLGSGFKIAMRDLEIRGAGNLLGAEQSGHITAVGFELYCQLLKQSVAVLKGEKPKRRLEVEVRFDFLESDIRGPDEPHAATSPYTERTPRKPIHVPASLPHRYILEPRHRIEMYRKLAQANDKSSVESLEKELRDRFGPIPAPAELLLQVRKLTILAGERGITAMETLGDRLMLTRNNDYIMPGGKFPRLAKPEAKARLSEIRRLILAH